VKRRPLKRRCHVEARPPAERPGAGTARLAREELTVKTMSWYVAAGALLGAALLSLQLGLGPVAGLPGFQEREYQLQFDQELQARYDEVRTRLEGRSRVVEEVLAGHLTLLQAADQFRDLLAPSAEARARLGRRFPGVPYEEALCRQVIADVEAARRCTPPEGMPEDVMRLQAELAEYLQGGREGFSPPAETLRRVNGADAPTGTPAGHWPQFRGPGALGVCAEAQLPTEWGPDTNVRWKVEIPGAGWSSPIVWDDKVFVTTAVAPKQARPKPFSESYGGPNFGTPPDGIYRWEVYCLDRATGKVLWKQVAAERRPAIPIHPSNSYASETPVTDGARLYAYFGMTGLFCYDLAGKLLWSKGLGTYTMQMGWGTGSSPAQDGDGLFVQCDNEEQSFLVALDKKTGTELWRVPRDEKSSWGTPFVWRNKVRTELVAVGGKKVRSYDPATGKLLWELGGMSGMATTTPVADDERLYTGSVGMGGGGSPLVAVKAGASGDITLPKVETSNAGVAWSRTRAGPWMPSPLLYRGYLYVLEARLGLLSCYDARTGQPAYEKQRLQRARGFTASPWAYAGRVFCLDQDGLTFVVKAGPKFELLATNQLDDRFAASPAAAGGDLFLRGVSCLYCIKP
jgi:outer membrane protein assembly factor BamB